MIARRGLTLVELDHQASTSEAPYGLIASDCPDPKEIDDGVFVEPLPTADETYRVGICVADASRLYTDKTIFGQAMANTEAKYWDDPNGSMGYEPMLDVDVIKSLEFAAGTVRSALIVSFIVGRHTPPSELEINFGNVEVTNNWEYKDLWRKCQPHESSESIGRAAALIIRHLRYDPEGEGHAGRIKSFKTVYGNLLFNTSHSIGSRGSMINEAYMIGAGHLVGRTLAAENWRAAIYRTHNPLEESADDRIPSEYARYSMQPSLHVGLNLNPHCRMTSPLRRLEDFMMSHQLKQRSLGHEPTDREVADMAAATQRLNDRIAQSVAGVCLHEAVAISNPAA